MPSEAMADPTALGLEDYRESKAQHEIEEMAAEQEKIEAD
jgi:hypothetical protein